MSMLVQSPDGGLNYSLGQNQLEPRMADDGSQNVIYERGFLRTANGFAKVDLTTTGLNSGESILHIFPFEELDGSAHLMAVTKTKIYEHDANNTTWNDLIPSGTVLSGNLNDPVSYAIVAHNGTGNSGVVGGITLDDDAAKEIAYFHCVVSDGGNSDILRWAGRGEVDFAKVTHASDYHDGTTHRALQVNSFQNRLILLTPYIYSSSAKTWSADQTQQRIQFPQVAKLQTWTGTGSGFIDLIDTGGNNVWSGLLGGQMIVYQTRGIWTLRHIGGKTVFDPYPYISDIGLMAPHMLISKNNVHYFVGNDYNVYAYGGGSVIKPVGDAIRDKLEEDINTAYQYRSWMALDKEEKRLWIFTVTGSNIYITKAYGMDLRTGVWTIRDYSGLFNGTTTGLSAVNLIGAQTATTGVTYKNILDTNALYDGTWRTGLDGADFTGGSVPATGDPSTVTDITFPQGEDLRGDLTSNVIAWSSAQWASEFSRDFTHFDMSDGGLAMCWTTNASDPAEDITKLWTIADETTYSGAIIWFADGSLPLFTNAKGGTNYFTIGDVSRQADGGGSFCARMELEPFETTGNAFADASTATPIININATATLFDPTGTTYDDAIEELLVGEELHLADTDGFVYKSDESLLADSGTSIAAVHITPVFDFQQPDIRKRWPGIAIVAKSATGTSITVQYDIDDAGFVTAGTQALTSSYEEYTFYINRTSKRIQFKFTGTAADFQMREFLILEPEVEDDR